LFLLIILSGIQLAQNDSGGSGRVGLFLASRVCVLARRRNLKQHGSVNAQGVNMKHAHRTDFWFAGVAILPAVFLCTGHPEAIFMLYPPLLIVACLFGMYEQKMEEQPPHCEAETPAPLADAAPLVASTATLDRNKTAEA
jgi:hypothetical protein